MRWRKYSHGWECYSGGAQIAIMNWGTKFEARIRRFGYGGSWTKLGTYDTPEEARDTVENYYMRMSPEDLEGQWPSQRKFAKQARDEIFEDNTLAPHKRERVRRQ